MDIAFGCRRIVFEWEGYNIEYFENDTSLSQNNNTFMVNRPFWPF